jgi:thiol-disulfide isomerase/thioredoxin
MRTRILLSLVFLTCFYQTQAQKMSDTTLIIGKIDRDQLDTYSWFAKNYNSYQADNTSVDKLQVYAPKLKLIIVMGTWCGDSQEHVPAFWKIATQCGIQESQVEMIGVNRQKHCPFPDISTLNIEYVPTFFVFYDNVRIGKIVETPKHTLEQDLLELLVNTKQ